MLTAELDHRVKNMLAVIQALVLRDVSQLEYAEIAEQLKLPLGTVKSRIHEARKQVRQTLGESYT